MITIKTKVMGRIQTMKVSVNEFCRAMRFRAEYLTPDMTKKEFKDEFTKHGLK